MRRFQIIFKLHRYAHPMHFLHLTQVAVGSHSRKLNKYIEIKAPFPLFQQNIISIDGSEAGHWSETEWDRSKEIFWLRDRWLIIHTCEDKNGEWKDTFLLMRSVWKKFIIENWSFDFLSLLISLNSNSGAPNVNFRKISVRKTIWDL